MKRKSSSVAVRGLLTGAVLVVLAMTAAAQTAAQTGSAPRTLTDPIHVTASTRIAPGTYHVAVPDGKAAIEIDADHVVLDLSGVTLVGSEGQPWQRAGIGVHALGHSHITIRGGVVRGYRFGIFVQQGMDIRILGSDVSGNRAQKLLSTATHFDVNDWVDIFHLDAWESYGSGLYLKDVLGAWVQDVTVHGAQNGILLANTSRSTVYECNVSHNSGWGIGLFHSTWNDVLNNHADWNVRCEGKTYSAGCDSAGVLLIDGSNHNRIVGNSFTHSGDGYFSSRPQSAAQSDDNYVAFNDGSYSPHNAFESTFTDGDQFFHNIADHSDYGFWMGFSHDTTVTDNHIEGSKHDGIAIEHGAGNVIVRNQIVNNGGIGIRLFRRQHVPDPSRDYVIEENTIDGNKTGILLNQTWRAEIIANHIGKNQTGIQVEKGSQQVVLRMNQFVNNTLGNVQAEPKTDVDRGEGLLPEKR